MKKKRDPALRLIPILIFYSVFTATHCQLSGQVEQVGRVERCFLYNPIIA